MRSTRPIRKRPTPPPSGARSSAPPRTRGAARPGPQLVALVRLSRPSRKHSPDRSLHPNLPTCAVRHLAARSSTGCDHSETTTFVTGPSPLPDTRSSRHHRRGHDAPRPQRSPDRSHRSQPAHPALSCSERRRHRVQSGTPEKQIIQPERAWCVPRYRHRAHAANSTSSPSLARASSPTAVLDETVLARGSRRSGSCRAQDTVTPDWSLYGPVRNFK